MPKSANPANRTRNHGDATIDIEARELVAVALVAQSKERREKDRGRLTRKTARERDFNLGGEPKVGDNTNVTRESEKKPSREATRVLPGRGQQGKSTG